MKKLLYFLLLLFSQKSALHCSEQKKTAESAMNFQSKENKELQMLLRSMLLTDLWNIVFGYCEDEYIYLKTLETENIGNINSFEKLRNFINDIQDEYLPGYKLCFLPHNILQLQLARIEDKKPSNWTTRIYYEDEEDIKNIPSILWDMRSGNCVTIHPDIAIVDHWGNQKRPFILGKGDPVETISQDKLLKAKLLTPIEPDPQKKAGLIPNGDMCTNDYEGKICTALMAKTELPTLKAVTKHEVELSINQAKWLQAILNSKNK